MAEAFSARVYVIEGLVNRTEYAVRVRASNRIGNGQWSPEVARTPGDRLASGDTLRVGLAAELRYTSPGLTPFVTMALSGAGQRMAMGASLNLAALDMNLAVMAEQTAPRLGPMTHGLRLELGRRY